MVLNKQARSTGRLCYLWLPLLRMIFDHWSNFELVSVLFFFFFFFAYSLWINSFLSVFDIGVRWRLTQRGCGLAGVVLILFYASSLWRHFQPWYKQRPKSSKKQKSFLWDTQYYSLNWSLSLVVILMDGGWTTQREPLAYLYVVNRAIYRSGWCALYKLFLLGAFFFIL